MEPTPNKKNLVDILFDPEISEILKELEDGEKELSLLSEKLQISEQEILERLSYLLQEKFVEVNDKKGKTTLMANSDKLSKALENENNFDNVVDGLTELDSYLN